MKLRPFEDRVAIIQDDAATQTASGLIIPEGSQRKPSQGTIVEVGPGKHDKGAPVGYLLNDVFFASLDGQPVNAEDRIVPVYTMPIKTGDRVLFSAHAGVKFTLEGQEYLIMRISEVITRI